MATAASNSARALVTPRAAAIAGVIFSILMSASLILIRLAIPPLRSDDGTWLGDTTRRDLVRIAVGLAPFAGIAFLWFIGVLRNRLGTLEDRFFATVLFGSGLLFVASLFASAAFAEALVEVEINRPGYLQGGGAYYMGRQLTSAIMNGFAIRMAGVFIFSTSTITLRTGILPRWIGFLGFACGAVLLLVITSWQWIALLFPFWMFVVSVRILVADLGAARASV